MQSINKRTFRTDGTTLPSLFHWTSALGLRASDCCAQFANALAPDVPSAHTFLAVALLVVGTDAYDSVARLASL